MDEAAAIGIMPDGEVVAGHGDSAFGTAGGQQNKETGRETRRRGRPSLPDFFVRAATSFRVVYGGEKKTHGLKFSRRRMWGATQLFFTPAVQMSR